MNNTIGNRISIKRRAANLTQDEIAQKVGLSRSLIGQIEKDRSMPTIDFIIKFVSIVNTSYQYILEGKTEAEGVRSISLPSTNQDYEYQKQYIKSLEAQIRLHEENSQLKDDIITWLKTKAKHSNSPNFVELSEKV